MTTETYGPASLQDAPVQPLTFGQSELLTTLQAALSAKLHLRLCASPSIGLEQLLLAVPLDEIAACTPVTIAFDGATGSLVEQQQLPQPAVNYCHQATLQNLFGHFSYHDESWSFAPGLLCQSENQLIVIDAAQLLADQVLNDALIATMKSGELVMPLPTSIKAPLPKLPKIQLRSVIVIQGNSTDLFNLSECYPELNVLAPLHLELVDRIHISDAKEYLGFLKTLVLNLGLEISPTGLQTLACVSSRWVEHNEFYSLASHYLNGILQEAGSLSQGAEIEDTHIEQVMNRRNLRLNDLPSSSCQDFVDGSILLDVTGAKVGQVNGLTVIDVGDICYGEPARITASVHYGDGDVIDIERKAELAGNIHAKGTMILAAYVSQIFAKDAPLHLSANIVFEQSYYEVDGDSASLAELVALLSALSRIPVYQHMAVTGAIDQFGNVQSIGGINEKIEGFWRIANKLAPEQQLTIVMPKSNLLHFNPSRQVQEALAAGKLKIASVTHIADALEVLTGVASGIGNENAQQDYPQDSIFGKVQQRLLDLADPPEPTKLSLLQAIRVWWRSE